MAVVAGVITGVGTAVGGAVKAGKAHKEMRRARSRKQEAKYNMQKAMANRAEITNPYAGVTDLSGLASDLSSQISNPFNQLTVSTAAAEMQAEEADIALANTLDTLIATGAGAGGATALAQAALQSKRGVSASLESQEAKNQELIARGEQQMQDKQMSEAQRVQNAQMTEAQRLQQADVLGKEFVYGEQERRETEQLNRKQAQITGQAQAQANASQQKSQIIGSGIGALGNIASSAVTGLAK